ncbi:hypothetical protein [Streptomyces chartreusis]|uniref:hypothetical protein n=1 Tax=Streptomyces chartreusis TaxID=1969 RepID=UPI0036443F6A
MDVDPPWPTGQCGEEPRQIFRAAIQPVVRDANDPFDPLSAVGVPACQVSDQLVESGRATPVLDALRPLSLYAATTTQPCSCAVRSLILS